MKCYRRGCDNAAVLRDFGYGLEPLPLCEGHKPMSVAVRDLRHQTQPVMMKATHEAKQTRLGRAYLHLLQKMGYKI